MAKQNRKGYLAARIALMTITTLLWMFPVTAWAETPVLETDVRTPSAGNVLTEVYGEFIKPDIPAILALVNSYRLEACREGYPDPRNPSRKLTMQDYSEMTWAGDMERIAQIRAAEAYMYSTHNRPNGNGCFSLVHEDRIGWSAECLAWPFDGYVDGITMWYGEKDAWVQQLQGAVTGHYTSMITPDNHALAVSCFQFPLCEENDLVPYCVSGEFSWSAEHSGSYGGVYGSCFQKMEVPQTGVSTTYIKGPGEIRIDEEGQFYLLRDITILLESGVPCKTATPVRLSGGWASSVPSVATISQEGKLKPLSAGTTSITATAASGEFVSFQVTVKALGKGDKFVSGGFKYSVTVPGLEASIDGPVEKTVSSKLVIPNTTAYMGTTYKITSIGKAAFGGLQLKNVTISDNVKVIGQGAFAMNQIKKLKFGKSVQEIKNGAFNFALKLKTLTIPETVRFVRNSAFFGNGSVKKLVIKTKQLNGKRVELSAFECGNIKTVVVPKKKKAAYKKLLTKRGVKKTARFIS